VPITDRQVSRFGLEVVRRFEASRRGACARPERPGRVLDEHGVDDEVRDDR